MAGQRFKRLDDLTADERIAYLRDGTIPVPMDPEEEEALREAGYDPVTRRPLADVEAETEAREAREAEVAEWEEMDVDDHMRRQREAAGIRPDPEAERGRRQRGSR